MNYSFEIAPVFGTLYAFPYYVEGITDTVYELYLPDASNITVYAYGTESLNNLTAYGYQLKAVAFYLPKKNITGWEIPIYLMYFMNPRENTLFAYSLEEVAWDIKDYYYAKERVMWAYHNNSDVCSNLSLDCIFGDWSEWSSCSALGDGGNQTRNRTIIARAFERDCTDETEEVSSCNVHEVQGPLTVQQVLTSLGIQVT